MHRYGGQVRVQPREHMLDRCTLEIGEPDRTTPISACDTVMHGGLGTPARSRFAWLEVKRQIDRVQQRRDLGNIGLAVADRGECQMMLELDATQLGVRQRQQLCAAPPDVCPDRPVY